MLRDVETVAFESRLHFLSRGDGWMCADDWPHITTFEYHLGISQGDGDELKTVGKIDGYRISQDWTIDDLQVWDEADAGEA